MKSSFSVPIQRILHVPRTVFEVRPPDELLEAASLKTPRPKAIERVEKSISRIVLERLLELDPDEFEILITELLTTLDFEAEKTRKTRDEGVDVEGTLNIYGFASVDLSVQVKRHAITNTIGPRPSRTSALQYRREPRRRSSLRVATLSLHAKKRKKKTSRGLG